MADILTGQMFEFSNQAYTLLQMLERPHTFTELHSRVPQADQDALSAYLQQLKELAVVLDPDSDEQQHDVFHIERKNTRLFNANQYDIKIEQQGIVVVGVPYSRGNARPNYAYNAPQVLRNVTNSMHIDLLSIAGADNLHRIFGPRASFGKLQELIGEGRVWDWGDLFLHDHEPAKNAYARIEHMARILFTRGISPVFLGGDHSITYPIIKECSIAHPGLQVLHIDAHTDTYTHKIDTIYNYGTHHHGNFATRSLELEGVAALYQFGVRGLGNIGQQPVSDKQTTFYIEETRAMARSGEEILPQLPVGSPIYLTLDIDVLDPSHAPGTSLPTPNGLSYTELLDLLAGCLRNRELVGFDIVEIDPEKDSASRTAIIGVDLILFLMSYLRPGLAQSSGATTRNGENDDYL